MSRPMLAAPGVWLGKFCGATCRRAGSLNEDNPFSRAREVGDKPAGTDPVAVPCQLVNHSESEDRLLYGVMEYVEADQSRVQIPVGSQGVLPVLPRFHFRHAVADISISISLHAVDWQPQDRSRPL